MRSLNGRRRRMLLPALWSLEPRRLLSVTVNSAVQDGVDLVGPTSSVGGDGVQDIDLNLSNLQVPPEGGTSIQSILVSSPGGFEWEYNNGDLSFGWANAEFFFPPSGIGPTGDLYINPIIDSNLNASGQQLNSSTGSPITLQSGDVLSLTVTYQTSSGTTFTDFGSTTIENLAKPPLLMTPTPTPANVQHDTMTVANDGQGNDLYSRP